MRNTSDSISPKLNLGLMNLAIVAIERFKHLFLPKDYSGSPTTSIYTPWSKEEAEDYLTTGWGEGAITEFNLDHLYGPEPEVSGE